MKIEGEESRCYNLLMVESKLIFYLNGKKQEIGTENIKDFSLLDFLRNPLRLTGSKKGCSEGDCGACTVVIGEYSPVEKKVVYKSITSCIYPVYKVYGKHIITIEGLEENGKLNEIQKAFIENHAIQCGFCTPGMIMGMLALLLNNPKPDEYQISKALSGNLCRCTGYQSIKNACVQVSTKGYKKPEFISNTEKQLKEIDKDLNFKPNFPNSPVKEYFIPSNLNSALKLLEEGSFTIFNGCSDIAVRINKAEASFEKVLDISGIKELKQIKLENGKVKIGGNITFNRFLKFAETDEKLKAIKDFFEFIGSNQIRNIGTIAGNISNASPIADSAIFLLSADAELVLSLSKGKRKVKLTDFYKGYKQIELNKNELIEWIEFEIPKGEISFLKTSKRKEVDIASVNSCVILELEGRKIKDISISFGGVFPYPIRVFKAENYLKGKEISRKLIEKAAEICKSEVKPISDVRGSQGFRKKLVYNQILKHFLKLTPEVFYE